MDRRAFLTATGVTALTAASGCVGETTDPASSSDSADEITTGTEARTTGKTDEKANKTTGTHNEPTRIRTPEPGDIALTVDRLGIGLQPEPKLVNESDATLDMDGSLIRFDTGQQHKISDLRLVPGAELDVVTAREGCSERVAERYPPIYTRCARFAQPASTKSGTVTVTNPNDEILTERDY